MRARARRYLGGLGCWRGAPLEKKLEMPIPFHPTAPTTQDRGELLPLDVLPASGGRASWGFEVVSLK